MLLVLWSSVLSGVVVRVWHDGVRAQRWPVMVLHTLCDAPLLLLLLLLLDAGFHPTTAADTSKCCVDHGGM